MKNQENQNSSIKLCFDEIFLILEAGLKTDSTPGKSRRSPLQTLYNGDQVRT